jgi:periplasmic copper chaperone A
MMKKIFLLITLSGALAAHAQVAVDQPWVRGTVAAQKATGAFMSLKSDKPVSLVSVASPAAKIVELHEMRMENNVMKMQAVSKLDIIPGKSTELKPGGYHVMLIDLVKPLSKGDSVPLTLEFKDADGKSSKQEIKAEVLDLTSGLAVHK